jgi:hypothetical protein
MFYGIGGESGGRSPGAGIAVQREKADLWL